MRIAVYTTILPYTYTELKPPLYVNPKVDYFVFSDGGNYPRPWVARSVSYNPGESPRQTIQRYKMLSDWYLCTYDYVIWHDGDIQLKVDPVELINILKRSGYGIAFVPHPYRDCAYREGTICVSMGFADADRVEKQLSRYRLLNYPEHNGLIASSFFIRDNTDVAVIRLMHRWHFETCVGCCRNQVSFNFSSWIENVPYYAIPWELLQPKDPSRHVEIWQDNIWYRRRGHVWQP